MFAQDTGIDLIQALKELLRSEQYIRAEVLVLLLVNAGVPLSLIHLNTIGTLHKPYLSDIVKADNKGALHFLLPRAGIYDQLPAGVFHRLLNETDTLAKAVRQYRQNRTEEINARLFFGPWERELFYQRLLVEQYEEVMSNNLSMVLAPGDDIENLPAPALLKIRLLLPYLHKIGGRRNEVSRYLEWILDERVELSRQRCAGRTTADVESRLNASCLGITTITGPAYYSDMERWEISIGPLTKPILEFMPGQAYWRVLNLCYKYLLPCDIEATTQYLFPASEQSAWLSDNATQSRIGLNLTI